MEEGKRGSRTNRFRVSSRNTLRCEQALDGPGPINSLWAVLPIAGFCRPTVGQDEVSNDAEADAYYHSLSPSFRRGSRLLGLP